MAKLTNFYDETIALINPEDIDYILATIGDPYGENELRFIDKEWFLEQAKRIDYDDSFGGEVINPSLKIVLKDGRWLERGGYDGSEWWELKGVPSRPVEEVKKDLGILFRDKHLCPHNTTMIDGVNVRKTYKSGTYQFWLETENGIIIEEHEYADGNYKPEHEEFLE